MVWHIGRAYGQDLRDRVLNAQGKVREVAARFEVSNLIVARARLRCRRHGEDTPGMQCKHVPLELSGLEHALANQVAAVNDWTLLQLCRWVQAEHGIQAGAGTMWNTLARLGLSLKKVTPCQRANASRCSAGKSDMASESA